MTWEIDAAMRRFAACRCTTRFTVPHSAQPPLVLLQGGGDTIRTSFGYILPILARDWQIIAFEQQGFGHTADIADRPLSFEQSADDTAALLDYLRIGEADLFGFSNGGTIALQVAIRHPRVVRKLVVASGLYQRHRSHGGDEADCVAGADGWGISGRRDT
jgi:pimeloyl-ACP methyl ester carboxylesterase